MSDPIDYDIAIVGYGPLGAMASLLLAHAGLRVVVLERDTSIYELPRAVALDGEAVRAFHRLGLAGEIVTILQPSRDPDRIYFTNSRFERLLGTEIPAVGLSGWPDISMFDQPELEHLLRRIIARSPQIDVRLGHEVNDLARDEAAVSLAASAPGAPGATQVRAAYVIGCDGASSFVRRHLGIAWQSLGYDHDWLVVDIRMKPGVTTPAYSMQVCDPARLATYVMSKDPLRRFEFKTLEGETREELEDPARVAELLRPWAAPGDYELLRTWSTSSTRPPPRGGGSAGCSSPETRPTRPRRSWARA